MMKMRDELHVAGYNIVTRGVELGCVDTCIEVVLTELHSTWAVGSNSLVMGVGAILSPSISLVSKQK